MLTNIQVLIEFPRFPQEIIQVATIGSHNAKQLLIAYISIFSRFQKHHHWLVVEPPPLKNMKVKGKDYPIYDGK